MKQLFYIMSLLMGFAFSANAQHTHYEVRYANSPEEVKHFDTKELRKHFLIDTLFTPNHVNMVYTFYDRLVIGGAMPQGQTLKLEAIPPLKSKNFLAHREIGIVNVGGPGVVTVGDKSYKLNFKEAIYIGAGDHEVTFASEDADKPALFYFNSANAHKTYPTKFIGTNDAVVLKAGSQNECNKREILKLIVNQTVPTCQLQLGLTELMPGNVWNTMPAHTHGRRTEVYFYFELPKDAAILHVMGEPNETRNIWVHNYQAVISPPWSIHAGAGTANYMFIWGMGGENLDYTDMDKFGPSTLQ